MLRYSSGIDSISCQLLIDLIETGVKVITTLVIFSHFDVLTSLMIIEQDYKLLEYTLHSIKLMSVYTVQ